MKNIKNIITIVFIAIVSQVFGQGFPIANPSTLVNPKVFVQHDSGTVHVRLDSLLGGGGLSEVVDTPLVKYQIPFVLEDSSKLVTDNRLIYRRPDGTFPTYMQFTAAANDTAGFTAQTSFPQHADVWLQSIRQKTLGFLGANSSSSFKFNIAGYSAGFTRFYISQDSSFLRGLFHLHDYTSAKNDGAFTNSAWFDANGTVMRSPTDSLKMTINGTSQNLSNYLTNGLNVLQDADKDTKIQVEESTDEDIIRFDIAGTEEVTLDGTGFNIGTNDIETDAGAGTAGQVLTHDGDGTMSYQTVAVQGANNGLQVTSNNVELGSGTNAASGTSADLTSARYIPMNGNKVEFRGTTITSANYPNLTISDDGDITAGVKDVSTTSASLTNGWGDMKYSRYWSNFSVGRNISSTNWKIQTDGRVITSAFFGEGLVGRQMRASILFGSDNTVDYAGTTTTPIINSLLGGRNTLFGGISTESFVLSSASNLDNSFANSIMLANTDTVTGTMQNSLYIMSQANATFGSATNNKNNIAISDNVTLNGNFRNNIFTLIKGTYSDAASPNTDPVFQNSSGSIVSGVHYQDDGAKSLSYGIATGYRQHYSGWGQFLFGGNIKSVANNVLAINLAGPSSGVTYATTSAWDIDNTTSNKMIVAAPNGYQFGTGTSPNAFATGVTLAAGASAWASISARDTKENFEVLDYQSIYNNFRNVNIEKWNYKGSPNKQLGIMAEDFYEVFGKDLGVVHNHEKIETTDALGACMLLIKAQQEKIDELESRIKNLEK